MLRHLLLLLAAAVLAVSACAPPRGELIPPIAVRVDASYACDDTTTNAPASCVFWRTSSGQVFYGPRSMVHLPPTGTDEIIPPPIVELTATP